MRIRIRPALALYAAVTAAAPQACSTTNGSVAAGGECLFASDCAPGLVCIDFGERGRICTDDLSSVAGRPPPEGGPADDAPAADAANDGASDAPAAEDARVEDTGTLDAGIDAGVDAGFDGGIEDAAGDG